MFKPSEVWHYIFYPYPHFQILLCFMRAHFLLNVVYRTQEIPKDQSTFIFFNYWMSFPHFKLIKTLHFHHVQKQNGTSRIGLLFINGSNISPWQLRAMGRFYDNCARRNRGTWPKKRYADKFSADCDGWWKLREKGDVPFFLSVLF